MLDDRVKRIELEDKRREDKKKAAAAARAAKKAKKDAADIAAGKKPRKARQAKGKQAPVDPLNTASGEIAGATPTAPDVQPSTSNPHIASGSSAPASVLPTLSANSEDSPDATDPDQGPEPPFSLHPDDPKNFLKLSESLGLLSQRIISEEDICTADRLLREYNTELITVRPYRFHWILIHSHQATALRQELCQAEQPLLNTRCKFRARLRPSPRILDFSL